MHLPTMQVLVTLLLAISVIYIVVKQFLLQYKVNGYNVPCVHQRICDYKDIVIEGYRFIAVENEESIKAKQREERRREYREWTENCNYLFGKESDALYDRKIYKQVIDGAA